MLNMNSPIVQNIVQSQSGFNPYSNGYIPQQPQMQNQDYGYNPYILNQQNQGMMDTWEFTYDPMPQVVMNEHRGINTSVVQRGGIMPQQPQQYMQYNAPFNGYGYMNPILMKNQMEAERLQQREAAILQGKIWRSLLQSENGNDEFDVDYYVTNIESLYYAEPIKDETPIKERIIKEKNNYFAELESRLLYYRENNLPIIDNAYIMNMKLCNYYNNINNIIGDTENCDVVDYFTRVYPELRHEELSWMLERQKHNLKNRYDTQEFNKLIDQASEDRSDSYYYKLMESMGSNGVKLTNGDGLTITPDEMEIRLPDRLIKNNQDKYYEQRSKFYNSIFNKGG